MNNPEVLQAASLIEQEIIEQVARLSTAMIADALGKTAAGVMQGGIKPIWRGARLLGTAFTVELPYGDNLFLHLANCLAGPGYVLVAAAQGCTDRAMWGDLMTRAAKQAGIAGLVTDGAARDQADIEEMRFPVFAAAMTPQGLSREQAGRINVPVTCGGIKVLPGDLVFGDDDGVVAVPRAKIEEVLQKARRKLDWEANRKKELETGQLSPDWLPETLRRLGVDNSLAVRPR